MARAGWRRRCHVTGNLRNGSLVIASTALANAHNYSEMSNRRACRRVPDTPNSDFSVVPVSLIGESSVGKTESLHLVASRKH